MKKSKVNPLSHYLLHGKSEGRVGLFEIEKHGKEGKQAFNSNKESIVVVSHESSATGAPLVGLNIGNELSKKYNIIHYILRESDLHEDFSERSCMVITDLKHRVFLISVKILQWLEQKYKIKSIICNSVETIDILQAANKLCIPSISLIHEFADYTRPVGKITNTVMMADKVVVPANIILDSLKRELKKTCNISITPNNISVYPQGKLPYIPAGHGKSLTAEQLRSKLKLERDTKLIVGAGFAQIRKGVDLFVDTAIKIKKKYKGKCKFVWVGSGYKPETDLAYSVWIEPHIENASMQDDIVFLEHQSSLDPILSITDVFCLTSRLDPFPNVVIDALQADVHVACFDKSTGCAEFLNRNRSNSSIAGYLDTEDLSNKIVSYIKQKNSQRGINKRLVAEKLDFSKYVQFIERCIDEARAFRDKSQSIDQFLSETHEFDSDYNDHNNKETAQKYYVERCLKGIHIRNPKPGFSDLEWISNEENGNYFTVPLYNALKKQISSTHKSVLLKDDTKGTSKLKSAQMYAVHLHLFYTDLASEFSDYFSNLPGNFDLFITVLDGEDIDAVKEKFKLCGARDTKVISVKNIGRDIAPLIIDLKEEITSGNYAFIGHFHSKKSLEVGGGLGDRWRKYLMNNLIGTEATAQQVLSLFNDNQIGLIFADDYHISDFGTNKVFADKICSDIGLPSMEHAFIFPLGTMFWARPQILLPLFESNFSTYLQQEPLPYDGSFMHAIERLIPHLCESSGYSYLTVYTENNYW
ncbi:hypothetical protein WH50_07145 [Pokkaliibacter plantistimulans]|uniref:Glycosyl transferase family 1 domain-containing protein n=1 Tax=Pokkaliibacter plantistimulans TaxID=1635171 RepID=A0ABX5M204_9GAMM|nr:hypothetical protein WH50_07145 [Pokkaliibacter plantistimulans]